MKYLKIIIRCSRETAKLTYSVKTRLLAITLTIRIHNSRFAIITDNNKPSSSRQVKISCKRVKATYLIYARKIHT